MRHLIYIVLIFAVGCADKEVEYLKSSHVNICSQIIQLGEKIDPDQLSTESITFNEDLGAYYISCDKPGIMLIGTGDQKQLLLVQESNFSFSQDSIVSDIMGTWYPEEKDAPLNDLKKVRYEIEQAIGKPTSIRPITWKKNDASLMVGNQTLRSGTVSFAQSKLDLN